MRAFVAAIIAGFVAVGGQADAAEIKAVVSTALKASFEEIAAQFEKSTGHKVVATFGPTGGIAKRVLGDEVLDLVILGGARVGDLKGKTAPDITSIARSAIGAGVAKGAPRPDISSEAAFKAALLNAKAVAVTDPKSGGGSAVYFARLFEQMGIAEALKPKLRYAAGGPGGYSGAIAAKGEADFALQPIPELMAVPGIEVVGPLPGAFQNITTYTAAIPLTATNAEAARALVKALTAPQAAPIYKAKGLDPA